LLENHFWFESLKWEPGCRFANHLKVESLKWEPGCRFVNHLKVESLTWEPGCRFENHLKVENHLREAYDPNLQTRCLLAESVFHFQAALLPLPRVEEIAQPTQIKVSESSTRNYN